MKVCPNSERFVSIGEADKNLKLNARPCVCVINELTTSQQVHEEYDHLALVRSSIRT